VHLTPHSTTRTVPLKNPVVFYKNPSSVCGSGDNIVIPSCAQSPEEVDYEGELAVVIGSRPVRNVSEDNALDYVLGYTAANDVSARRWQGKRGGGQWSYSKSFDTFCPLGPALLVANPSVNPNKLIISTRLNGA
jgi:2-keto-4-pentenoate hydratase/2-oxohepta-3-ene-1,7-dioic acid hydratase in catechol pathway